MAVMTLTGGDTLTLDGNNIVDLCDGDTSTITFENNLVEYKTGKNRNSIFAKNEQGNNAVLSLRVNRGSADDKRLQRRLSEYDRNPTGFILVNGTFVKRLGDGQGNTVKDTYSLNSGIFTKNVDTKENIEGDTEQAVSIYTIAFVDVRRSFS